MNARIAIDAGTNAVPWAPFKMNMKRRPPVKEAK